MDSNASTFMKTFVSPATDEGSTHDFSVVAYEQSRTIRVEDTTAQQYADLNDSEP